MPVTPKDFGKVALLMGGTSAEREVSLMSGKVVLEALQTKGIDVHPVDVGTDVIQQLQAMRPDRVFNILHGRGGEDGVIQGALELLGIPYTGSGVAACALAMDKQRSKWIWQRLELPTLPFIVYDQSLLGLDFSPARGRGCPEGAGEGDGGAIKELGLKAIELLGLPLCVKPIYEGSSNGVTRVGLVEEFAEAYAKAQQYHHLVMIEPWLDGPEYTICILNGRALPVICIQTPQGFYDYQAKYFKDDTEYFCPCGLTEGQEHAVQELALKAFASLGCSGWGRVDMVRDKDGKFWLLEVNIAPGMTTHSLMPKAAKAAGMDIPDLVWNILTQTLESK